MYLRHLFRRLLSNWRAPPTLSKARLEQALARNSPTGQPLSLSSRVSVAGLTPPRLPGNVRPLRRCSVALPKLPPGKPFYHCLRRPLHARVLGPASLHNRISSRPWGGHQAVLERHAELRSSVGECSLPFCGSIAKGSIYVPRPSKPK